VVGSDVALAASIATGWSAHWHWQALSLCLTSDLFIHFNRDPSPARIRHYALNIEFMYTGCTAICCTCCQVCRRPRCAPSQTPGRNQLSQYHKGDFKLGRPHSHAVLYMVECPLFIFPTYTYTCPTPAHGHFSQMRIDGSDGVTPTSYNWSSQRLAVFESLAPSFATRWTPSIDARPRPSRCFLHRHGCDAVVMMLVGFETRQMECCNQATGILQDIGRGLKLRQEGLHSN